MTSVDFTAKLLKGLPLWNSWWHVMNIHDMSWHVMINHGVLSWKIPKYHQMSPKIFICNELWILTSWCHQMSWSLITKNVSKNMVTFSDISWLIMTLSNQLAEVLSEPKDSGFHSRMEPPAPIYTAPSRGWLGCPSRTKFLSPVFHFVPQLTHGLKSTKKKIRNFSTSAATIDSLGGEASRGRKILKKKFCAI